MTSSSSVPVPERLKSLEVTQENFMTIFEKFAENTDKNFNALTLQSSEIAVAVVQIVATNKHIETSLLKAITAVENEQREQKLLTDKKHDEKQMHIEGVIFRVSELELKLATTAGYKKAKDETKSFYLSNWFNIVKFIMGLSTAIGAIYYIANHVIK